MPLTAIEALLEVQQALRDRGLPGGAGLREADRTFIVVLSPDDHSAAPAVAELLGQMGCEVAVNGFVYGKVTGRLLPASELPPLQVWSADCCHAAEQAAVTVVRRCAGPCGLLLPVSEFCWLNRAAGKRGPRCRPCDAARVKLSRAARAGAAQVR